MKITYYLRWIHLKVKKVEGRPIEKAEKVLIERERLSALVLDVSTALNQSDSLSDVLGRCAQALVEHLDAAFARIWTLNRVKDILELQASAGMYTHIDGLHSRIPVGKFKIGLIAKEGKPYLTNEVIGDNRVHDQEWAKEEGMIAFAGYPLILEDRMMGVIATFARKPLSEATLQAMSSVANEIALGIERKRVEEEIKSLAKFPSENPNPVLRIAKDGVVLYANDASGPLLAEWDCETGGFLSAEWKSLVEEIYSSQISSEVEVKCGDLIFSVLLTPVKGTHYINGYGRDITERKQAEGELLGQASILQSVLDSIGDGVVVADENGKFLLLNPAAERIAGIGSTDVTPDKWSEEYGAFLPDARTPFPTADLPLMRAIRGEVVDQVEVFMRNPKIPDGVYLSVTGGPLRDKMGALKGGVVIFRDISERVRAEEILRQTKDELETRVTERTAELSEANQNLKREIDQRLRTQEELQKAKEVAEAANRAKSHFLANMSHELRTPLNAVIGFSEILSDKTFGELNERQARYIGNIMKSGVHLLELINDILDLSKVEAGKLELELSMVKIKGLLENSLIMVKEKALKHGISLDLDVPDELLDLEVRADERKLKQIMFNLLSNAVKFTPDGGGIEVKVGGEGEEFLISVADTGIGINPEDQERIFNTFEQVDSTYSRDQQGAGLGLALTKSLIEVHGGRIWIESQGEGKGSTFVFVIPLEAQEPKEEVSLEATPMVPDRTAPPGPKVLAEPGVLEPSQSNRDDSRSTILVVEDDPNASELITHHLTEAGYAVAHAFDGKGAVKIARRLRPDAITLDILMPEKDGWEVLGELKSTPETRDIPVIIVSISEDRGLGFSLGAIEWLVKPVDKETLIEVVSKAVVGGKDEEIRVLIVNDETKSNRLLTNVLQTRGFKIIQAYGFEGALDLVVEENPDIIVVDLLMPDMTGFDLVRGLRGHSEVGDIPIVIYTDKELTREDKERLDGHIQAIASKAQTSKKDLLGMLEKVVGIKRTVK